MPKKLDTTPDFHPVRVELCIELLARGMRAGQVAKAVAERHKITVRQAQKDLAKARQLLCEMSEEKREEHRGRIGTFLWRQARNADDRQDGNTAVAAMRELAKLFGLYEATKIEHNVKSGVLVIPTSGDDE